MLRNLVRLSNSGQKVSRSQIPYTNRQPPALLTVADFGHLLHHFVRLTDLFAILIWIAPLTTFLLTGRDECELKEYS
jgi:hypothetical protein